MTKRIALLGDAAFVVRPHTAMGVSNAAGDAIALSYALAQADDLATALAAYDATRRGVGNEIAAMDADSGRHLSSFRVGKDQRLLIRGRPLLAQSGHWRNAD